MKRDVRSDADDYLCDDDKQYRESQRTYDERCVFDHISSVHQITAQLLASLALNLEISSRIMHRRLVPFQMTKSLSTLPDVRVTAKEERPMVLRTTPVSVLGMLVVFLNSTITSEPGNQQGK